MGGVGAVGDVDKVLGANISSACTFTREHGTYKTVKARFWPRLSGISPETCAGYIYGFCCLRYLGSKAYLVGGVGAVGDVDEVLDLRREYLLVL